MRHRKDDLKLGRTPEHRKVLLAGLVCHLISRRRIRTTVRKAKAARRLADRMITLARRGTLAARRAAVARLRRKGPVKILFDNIAPALQDRAGGYTRIVRLGRRAGDGAEMALLEWVNYVPQPKPKKKKKEEEKGKPAPEQPAKPEEAAAKAPEKSREKWSLFRRGATR